MNATLKGPHGQTSLESSPNPYTIGRAPDNQLVMNDAKTSSYHAQIRPSGQSYEIIDLASSNGTFVNEQQLAPNLPRLLAANDHIRIGDTTFVFEASVAPAQSVVEATVYGGGGQGSSPSNPAYSAYAPTVAVQPPAYTAESYGVPQNAYAPPPYATNGYNAPPPGFGANVPAQQKKSGRGKLWLILGAIVGIIVIAAIGFGIIGYVNRPTTTKTLDAFCTALKGGDFQTAYNQLSSGLQAKYGSEAAFAQAYSTSGGLGKITNCSVSNVNDGADTGTISYVLSQGSANSIVVDYTLINENSALKINAQKPRSTPTLTLNSYCNALAQQDYQTAYNQFSTSLQSQVGAEAQFAAYATANNIKGCTMSNVNDSAGTGTLTYIRGDGNKTSASATLTNQNSTWKINALQAISSPTETLLTYCNALKTQDYQTAYAQLSSAAQSQETESQFAANFSTATVSDCKVSNVNDTAGTGTITYTLSNGNTGPLDYTLVNESGTWKINSEKQPA
ncbi:MAG TPA: FHA domain-containing protein [Ktedonobacteraceae bacterium]|nr:FHA domain-containing protein [Ktedonobacteraceae bacterium]